MGAGLLSAPFLIRLGLSEGVGSRAEGVVSRATLLGGDMARSSVRDRRPAFSARESLHFGSAMFLSVDVAACSSRFFFCFDEVPEDAPSFFFSFDEVPKGALRFFFGNEVPEDPSGSFFFGDDACEGVTGFVLVDFTPVWASCDVVGGGLAPVGALAV